MSGQFLIVNQPDGPLVVNYNAIGWVNPYFVPAGQATQQNPMRNPNAIVRISLVSPGPGYQPGPLDITTPADIAHVRAQCLSMINSGDCLWFTAPIAGFGQTTAAAATGGTATPTGAIPGARSGTPPTVKRPLSAATRRKMALAQKQRQATLRQQAQTGTTGDGAETGTSPPPTGRRKGAAKAKVAGATG